MKGKEIFSIDETKIKGKVINITQTNVMQVVAKTS